MIRRPETVLCFDYTNCACKDENCHGLVEPLVIAPYEKQNDKRIELLRDEAEESLREAKTLSVESILQTICKQARLKLGIERMDAKTKEEIQRETMVSLTDVPFDRALKALGEHCGFTAFYSKDESKCYIELPKHLKK